jgi:hypothetical protein
VQPEVDGVLPRAAADLQHLSAVGEDLAEHTEDGLLVLAARWGVELGERSAPVVGTGSPHGFIPRATKNRFARRRAYRRRAKRA